MILKFSQNYFWDSWILVYCRFDSYFTFVAKKKILFFHYSIIIPLLLLSERGLSPESCWQFAMWRLVAYKLLVYKKIICSKSIHSFSTSRLANVEDFFNVNIFLKCRYVRVNDHSFKYVCVVCYLRIRFYCLTFSAMSNLN